MKQKDLYFNIKKIVSSVVGSINFLLVTKPSITLQTILSVLVSENKIGAKISQPPFTLLVEENPAINIITSAVGEADQEINTPSLNISSVNSAIVKSPQTPSFDLQQLIYNLTRTVGGNSASLSTTGTQGWTNASNSVSGTNGRKDSLNATFTGQALATRNGTISIDYENLINKNELIIRSVILKFYFQISGTTLNNGDTQLKWNKGGADFSLITITGNENSSVTAEEFDITSEISSWTDLDNLQTKILCSSTVAETWSCNLDAIEVEIIANKTDVI